jgi:hypothetical protein
MPVPADHKWARDFAIVDVVFQRFKKMKPHYPKLRFDPAATKVV